MPYEGPIQSYLGVEHDSSDSAELLHRTPSDLPWAQLVRAGARVLAPPSVSLGSTAANRSVAKGCVCEEERETVGLEWQCLEEEEKTDVLGNWETGRPHLE